MNNLKLKKQIIENYSIIQAPKIDKFGLDLEKFGKLRVLKGMPRRMYFTLLKLLVNILKESSVTILMRFALIILSMEKTKVRSP